MLIYAQFLPSKHQTCVSTMSFDIVLQITIGDMMCCYCTKHDAGWCHSSFSPRSWAQQATPPPPPTPPILYVLYDKYRHWLLHLHAHVHATMPAHKVSFISHAFLMFSATTVAVATQPASCNKDMYICMWTQVSADMMAFLAPLMCCRNWEWSFVAIKYLYGVKPRYISGFLHGAFKARRKVENGLHLLLQHRTERGWVIMESGESNLEQQTCMSADLEEKS